MTYLDQYINSRWGDGSGDLIGYRDGISFDDGCVYLESEGNHSGYGDVYGSGSGPGEGDGCGRLQSRGIIDDCHSGSGEGNICGFGYGHEAICGYGYGNGSGEG